MMVLRNLSFLNGSFTKNNFERIFKMAIQFAKDEKVIKSFSYATVGQKNSQDCDTFKSLIVTNKRVIHEAVREKRFNELILRQEMPVADAKYVKTTVGKTATPKFLVLAIIFALLTAVAVVVSRIEAVAKFQIAFWIAAGLFALLAIVMLIRFFLSITKIVSFSIFTDHVITPVMSTAVIEQDNNNADGSQNKKAKKEPELVIRVNDDIAREIADGLGAAILDAIAYKEEDHANEVQEDIPAFAVTETEEISVDTVTSEETTEENVEE